MRQTKYDLKGTIADKCVYERERKRGREGDNSAWLTNRNPLFPVPKISVSVYSLFHTHSVREKETVHLRSCNDIMFCCTICMKQLCYLLKDNINASH